MAHHSISPLIGRSSKVTTTLRSEYHCGINTLFLPPSGQHGLLHSPVPWSRQYPPRRPSSMHTQRHSRLLQEPNLQSATKAEQAWPDMSFGLEQWREGATWEAGTGRCIQSSSCRGRRPGGEGGAGAMGGSVRSCTPRAHPTPLMPCACVTGCTTVTGSHRRSLPVGL